MGKTKNESENLENVFLSRVMDRCETFHSIIEENLKTYMREKGITKSEFIENGRTIIYHNCSIENEIKEYWYKDELILICRPFGLFIEIKYNKGENNE